MGKAEGKGCGNKGCTSPEENGWSKADECSHAEEIVNDDEGAVGGQKERGLEFAKFFCNGWQEAILLITSVGALRHCVAATKTRHWLRVSYKTNIPVKLGLLILVLSVAVVVFLATACRFRQNPSLQETIEFMQRSLKQHNGQRIQQPQLAPDVNVIANLSSEGCKLTYQVTQFETVQYDLPDIDPKSIHLKQIGNTYWAVFRTRNFGKSVRYIHPGDPSSDYSAEDGGFSLDSKEVAESFAKALGHAVTACGGKSSTF
jgi:hypothetical protein